MGAAPVVARGSTVMMVRMKYLQRWQLALHCYPRMPNSPLIFDFNHARGRLRGPILHQLIKFQHNWAMHGWVIEDLASFPASFSRGGRWANSSTTPSLLPKFKIQLRCCSPTICYSPWSAGGWLRSVWLLISQWVADATTVAARSRRRRRLLDLQQRN